MKRILFLQGVTWLLAAQLQVKPAARQHSNISPQYRTEPGPQYLNIVFSLHLGSFRIEHLRQAIPSDLEANQGSAYKDHQGHNFILAYWLWMHYFEWRLPQWLLAGSLTCGTLSFGYTIHRQLANFSQVSKRRETRPVTSMRLEA